jgi:hypothetical protein
LDFVVLGLIFGSVLAIIGFLIHELAGRAEVDAPAWLGTAGLSLMVSALFIWGITAAVAFADIDDGRARVIVIIATVLAVIATVLASLLFQHGKGTTGQVGLQANLAKTSSELSGWTSPDVTEPSQDIAERPVDDDSSKAGVEDSSSIETTPESLEQTDSSELRTSDYWLQTWLSPEAKTDAGMSQQNEEEEPTLALSTEQIPEVIEPSYDFNLLPEESKPEQFDAEPLDSEEQVASVDQSDATPNSETDAVPSKSEDMLKAVEKNG